MKFGIGMLYGWIYILFFVFVNIILMFIYLKHYTKRIFTIPEFTNAKEKIFSIIYAFFFNSTMVLVCFLPISTGINLYIGLAIYIISLFVVISALYFYAKTEPSKPVTNGIYKLSRHPQQVFCCIMIIGIGIMVLNIIVIISGIIQLFLMYPSLVAQENYCIKKYGDDYQKYLFNSPRYFLFI